MMLRSSVCRVVRVPALRQTSFLPKRPRMMPAFVSARPSQIPFSTEITAGIKNGEKMETYPQYFNKVKASNGSTISLSSYKGKKPVVLFFYPKAGTPGCTKQAQTFRDLYKDLKKLGAEVFGISGDTLEEQKAFANAESLPFPLLVDEGNQLRKGFGIPADLFGALPGRQTIVIDKNGTCILSYNNQFGPESHAKEAIKALS